MRTTPTVVNTPICKSALERTFDVPFSNLYRTEAIAPDGTTRIFENVRAYTSGLTICGDHIGITIDSKNQKMRAKVDYPYHYYHNQQVLGALKIFEMRNQSDEKKGLLCFALNYNLFCLPWKMCIIVHRTANGEVMASLTSREDWDRGKLESQNREVQMFLTIDANSWFVPIDRMAMLVDKEIEGWFRGCKAELVRKG